MSAHPDSKTEDDPDPDRRTRMDDPAGHLSAISSGDPSRIHILFLGLQTAFRAYKKENWMKAQIMSLQKAFIHHQEIEMLTAEP